MARDVRQLRAEASEAAAAGKHKRALAAYLELEQLEPRDAQWSKRAAETYRRLDKNKEAISAFARAADRYAQGGFLVQAIAVCKLILQIDPKNDDALRRIASMNEQIGAGPTRATAMAEANPTLADNAAVSAWRSKSGTQQVIPQPASPPPEPAPAVARTRSPQISPNALANAAPPIFPEPGERNRPTSTAPPLAISRTKSKPITLQPDRPIESISLKDEVPASFEREEKSGVYVIPIDDLPIDDIVEGDAEGSADYEVQQDWQQVDEVDDEPPARDSAPLIEIEDPDAPSDGEAIELEPEEVSELDMEEIEEIPLGEPRLMPAAAAAALARTPLFAGLSQDALESLVQELTLVQLTSGEVLFREGDPGDALYVIVEGEVAVQAEGPPRVEMARLGAGAFIGEVALMIDQPRSATIMATTEAELLRIDRTTLSTVLATHGEVLAAVLRFVRDRLVDRWTRTSPLFRPFDDGVRAQIASRFKFLEIETGSKLLDAGKKPDGLYIVLAGKFAVQRAGAKLAMVGPGELIGETALLSGAAFKSEVVAHGKSLALCLPASDFRELIMTHPHVLEYIGEAAEQSRKLEIL
jgi:CRP-like cAMP-binding protein